MILLAVLSVPFAAIVCTSWVLVIRAMIRHTRPPVLGNAATPPAAAPAYPDGQTPAPGHPRGNNMVIDTWECGCIFTWTRAAGWAHDFDCLDAELRRLLAPAPGREWWDT